MPISTADTVVVGAGVIGLTTALMLAREGRRVTVLERDPEPSRASWAAAGILSPLIPWRYPQVVQQLALRSQAVYPSLIAEVAEMAGMPVECHDTGMLLLDAEETAEGIAWGEANGVSVRLADEPLLHELLGPDHPVDDPAGLWLPAVSGLRNPQFLQALLRACESLGVSLRFSEEVQEVVVKNNKISHIETDKAAIECGKAIVCAGAWSRELLSPWLVLPLRPVRGQMLLFDAGDAAPPVILQRAGRYLVPRRDGLVLCGSSAEEAGFDCETTGQVIDELRTFAVELWPPLARVLTPKHWAGLRPATEDERPLIGPVPGIEDLYLNTGHYRSGIVCAPESARLLCDYVVRKREIPAELLPERLMERSPV